MSVKKFLSENRNRLIWVSVLVMMFFGIDYTLEYATDTYSTFFESDSWTYSIYQNGRPLQALLFYLIEKMGLSGPKCYYASWFIAIIALILACVLLSIILDKHMNNEFFSVIIAFITLANPMIVEYFLFVEKGMFMCIIFLNVVAVYFTEKLFYEEKRPGRRLVYVAIIAVCLLTAVTTYQVSVNTYVVMCLPLIICTPENFVRKNVFVAVMYAIPMGISVIIARMLSLGRLGGFPGVIKGLASVAHGLREIMFGSFWYMRNGRMLLFFILSLVLIVLSVLAEKKLTVAFGYIYIVLGCVMVSFLLHFATGDDHVNPRIVYSFGMIFGVVLIYFAFLQKSFSFGKYQSILRKGSVAVSLILIVAMIVCEYIAFSRVFIERYKLNAADMYYAQIIEEQIKEYEEATGNKIDTFCYYSDKNRTWYEKGLDESQMNTRAQSCGWSRLTSINTYLGTNYVEGEPDPKYEKYFAEKDWGTYSSEQVILEDNRIHICIY